MSANSNHGVGTLAEQPLSDFLIDLLADSAPIGQKPDPDCPQCSGSGIIRRGEHTWQLCMRCHHDRYPAELVDRIAAAIEFVEATGDYYHPEGRHECRQDQAYAALDALATYREWKEAQQDPTPQHSLSPVKQRDGGASPEPASPSDPEGGER